MGRLVVSRETRLEEINARCSGNDAGLSDVAEYAAYIEYRMCLTDLGMTEDDLEGGEMT